MYSSESKMCMRRHREVCIMGSMGGRCVSEGSYYYTRLIVLTDEPYRCKHRRNDQCYLPARNELNTIDFTHTAGLQYVI